MAAHYRRCLARVILFSTGGAMTWLRSLGIINVLASSLVLAQSQDASASKQPLKSLPPQASEVLQFQSPVAEFSQHDLTQKTWRVADFRGKFTVLLIWSVPPPPSGRWLDMRSTMVLPEAQRFYDETKNSKTLQLLTLGMDADRAALLQYVQQHHYTFPVLYGWHLADSLGSVSGDYLLVDPAGRRSNIIRSWSFGRLLYEAERLSARK
jgi:hypothetical protein